MTEKEQTRTGRCLICGQVFFGMAGHEYEKKVSRHILDNHRDQPPDKPLVEVIEEND